tara:strand:+ start:2479 stop:3069 length:591 start_codon:yes stop_codon:yes gene_type:complete
MAVDPFTAMMIMKGVSTVMNHQGQKAAAAAQRAWKYKKDLAIKRRLQLQYSQARQAGADTNMMRSRNQDIKSMAGVDSVIQQMKVASAMKASGLAQGQSSDNLLARVEGDVLRGESKILDSLKLKNLQLDYRDRDIQAGMDMAWLDAKAQIAGTTYQKDPGIMGLAMGLGSAYMDAKAFDSKMDGKWSKETQKADI